MNEPTNKAEPFVPKITPQKEEEIRQFNIQNSVILTILQLVFFLLGSFWFIIHMFK